jgi:hypothetical protein
MSENSDLNSLRLLSALQPIELAEKIITESNVSNNPFLNNLNVELNLLLNYQPKALTEYDKTFA